jgi:hypothetical protein
MVDTAFELLNVSPKMKASFITAVCVVALLMSQTTPTRAAESDPVSVAADVLVVRPACLVATIVGSALFVIALPVAATSKSIKPTARALVSAPAKATFTRPLGDMAALTE